MRRRLFDSPAATLTLAVAVALGASGTAALAAQPGPDYEVNTIAEPGDGVCDPAGTGDGCTLREAVAAADSNPDSSTITFDAVLAGQTISLMNVGDTTFGPSALAVTTQILLQGLDGNSGITIARDTSFGPFRLFYVGTTGSLTLRNLTLADGHARGGHGAVVPGTPGAGGEGGGGGASGLGGAIFNQGDLFIDRSTLTRNTATGGNGGIPVCISSAGSGGGGLNGDGEPATTTSAGGANGGGAGSRVPGPGDPGGFGGGGGGGSFACDGGGCFGRDGGAGGFGGGGGGGGGFNNPGIDGGPGGFGGGNGGEAGQGCGAAGGGGGAGLGGAIFNHGRNVAIDNSTLSGNTAQGGSGGNGDGGTGGNGGSGFGGGLFNLNGQVLVTNSTLASNTAAGGPGGGGGAGNGSAGGDAGGAAYNLAHEAVTYSNGSIDADSAVLNVRSTILADSTASSDVANEQRAQTAIVRATSPNIIETPVVNVGGTVNGGGILGVDPALDPLAPNGGPTHTHALRTASPAVDQGDSFGATNDQRGFPRPLDDTFVGNPFDGSDIGAYETCCNDRNQCTIDTCDPTNGACTFTPDDTQACTDDDACTSDACVNGTCESTSILCDDRSACTTDTCDPATGCVYTADDTLSCSDGDPCSLDVCVNGICATLCPPGFTPVSGGCLKAYDIDASLLDNQGDLCGPVNYYNADLPTGSCSGLPYGFHWTDDPTIPGVIRIDVELQAGITCNPGGVSATSLNGTPVGSFAQPGDCACNTQSFTVSQPDLDSSAYLRGVTNSFSIESFQCEGLSNDGPFGPGLFARASVTYGPIPVVCDDMNPCTDDSCDPASGCVYTPNTAPCDDGDLCTTQDACSGGQCIGGGPPPGCDDGNPCTVGDECVAGTCGPGVPRTCNDGNPCTDDSCDPQSTSTDPCVYTPNTAPCDDANACTTEDVCGGGTCGGEPVRCAPPDQCHFPGTCDPATGGCTYPPKPDGTTCTDGNACTSGDRCVSGTCQGGGAVTCAPPDSCHNAGTCNPSSGCVYPAKPNGTYCNDGSACTTGDKCQSGTCTGTPKICTAPDSCKDATCNPSTGACSYPAKPNGSACNDGNRCTTGDSCQSGTCSGGPACVAPDACHSASCNSYTGACSYPVKPNGSSCSDGNACTTGDKCQSGACTGTPKTCTPSSACHTSTCNPANGTCSSSPKPEGAACSDGNACTTGDSCQAGACRSIGVVACPVPDQCHNPGTCNTSTGVCSNPTKPNGTACNDTDPCTTYDTCRDGTCSGNGPDCPSGAGTVEADTTLRERYAYQNFGSGRELEASSYTGSRSLILVRVRVSGGASVADAKLRLVLAGGSGSSGASIHPVHCNWTELGATWSGRPTLGPTLDTKTTTAPNQAVDFDVSSEIQGDGTYCFGIDAGAGSYRYKSRESITGGRPSLILECACDQP